MINLINKIKALGKSPKYPAIILVCLFSNCIKKHQIIIIHILTKQIIFQGASTLRQKCSQKLITIALDVTKTESIEAAYDTVCKNIPTGCGQYTWSRYHSPWKQVMLNMFKDKCIHNCIYMWPKMVFHLLNFSVVFICFLCQFQHIIQISYFIMFIAINPWYMWHRYMQFWKIYCCIMFVLCFYLLSLFFFFCQFQYTQNII